MPYSTQNLHHHVGADEQCPSLACFLVVFIHLPLAFEPKKGPIDDDTYKIFYNPLNTMLEDGTQDIMYFLYIRIKVVIAKSCGMS